MTGNRRRLTSFTAVAAVLAAMLAASLTGLQTASAATGRSAGDAKPAVASDRGVAALTSTLTASLSCDGTNGHWRFECWLTATGGTTPYTVTWSGTNVSYATTSTTYASGYCTNGIPYNNIGVKVIATVRDSAGHSATASQSFLCYYVAP
jgi:hypothetical protein